MALVDYYGLLYQGLRGWIAATYELGVSMGSRRAGLMAAVFVASCPMVITFSRTYNFAMPAALIATLALLAILRSKHFRSNDHVLWLGVLLGLMPLARTMTVAFVPGLAAAAFAVVVIDPLDRGRRLAAPAFPALAALTAIAFEKAFRSRLAKWVAYGLMGVVSIAAFLPRTDLQSPLAYETIATIPRLGGATFLDGRGNIQRYEAAGGYASSDSAFAMRQIDPISTGDSIGGYADWLQKQNADACVLLTSDRVSGDFEPVVNRQQMEEAAVKSGFTLVKHWPAPDGQIISMWQPTTLIDDYGHWQGARKAVDEYFVTSDVKMLLNRIDCTGRLGVKT